MESPTEESSSLETTFSTDSPSSSGFLDQETSQEGKHNQAKTRIEEIDKLNKKLEIKLLSAPKDQVNQLFKFFNFKLVAIKKQINQNNAVKEYYGKFIHLSFEKPEKPKE
jgi:hypothetical protein